MQALRIFAVSSVFSYRALFSWLRPSAYIANKLAFPLLQLSFFAMIGTFGGAQPLSFYVLGNAILVVYQAMFVVATSVGNERWEGTLPYVLASPAHRVALFFGRASVHVLDGMLDVIVAFTFAVVVFGVDLSQAQWAGLAAGIFVATVAASAMGLAIGAASFLVLDASFLANLAMFVVLLLSGANVPIAELPGWLQAVAWALPLTRSVEAVRGYAAGADLLSGLPLLATDLAIGLAWAIGGYLLFSWFEERARRMGTLDRV
ncbi:MAG TPA: ABC transporter permease [Candidatus Limnocylindria bacterium]|nr:ABC transporter permease [Candidatus Limnocylindria bacterium]